MVALGFLLGGLGACLVLLARDLDVPRTHLAWLSAGFGAALLAAGPLGPIVLRWGADTVMRASAAVLAIGTAGLALAPVLVVAQVGALLLGVGGAGLVLATPALMAGHADAARRLSRVNAIASLAGVLGPPVLSAADLLPGSGRLALLISAPVLVWMCTRPAGGRAPSNRRPAPVAPRQPANRPWAMAGVLARWTAIVFAVMTEFCYVVWGAARLQDSGLSVSAAAAAAVAFPLGMATGRVAAARLLDRLPFLSLSLLLVLTGTVVLVSPANPVLCIAGLGLVGLGIAVLYPLMLANLMREPGLGEHHAAAIGATASGTAILSAPLLISGLASVIPLRAAFLVVIPMLAGLAVLRPRQ